MAMLDSGITELTDRQRRRGTPGKVAVHQAMNHGPQASKLTAQRSPRWSHHGAWKSRTILRKRNLPRAKAKRDNTLAVLDSQARALREEKTVTGKAVTKKSAKDESGRTNNHKRGKAGIGTAAGKTTKQKRKSGWRDCRKDTRREPNGKRKRMDGDPKATMRHGKRTNLGVGMKNSRQPKRRQQTKACGHGASPTTVGGNKNGRETPNEARSERTSSQTAKEEWENDKSQNQTLRELSGSCT